MNMLIAANDHMADSSLAELTPIGRSEINPSFSFQLCNFISSAQLLFKEECCVEGIPVFSHLMALVTQK
jgi:hypothetical protein